MIALFTYSAMRAGLLTARIPGRSVQIHEIPYPDDETFPTDRCLACGAIGGCLRSRATILNGRSRHRRVRARIRDRQDLRARRYWVSAGSSWNDLTRDNIMCVTTRSNYLKQAHTAGVQAKSRWHLWE